MLYRDNDTDEVFTLEELKAGYEENKAEIEESCELHTFGEWLDNAILYACSVSKVKYKDKGDNEYLTEREAHSKWENYYADDSIKFEDQFEEV